MAVEILVFFGFFSHASALCFTNVLVFGARLFVVNVCFILCSLAGLFSILSGASQVTVGCVCITARRCLLSLRGLTRDY